MFDRGSLRGRFVSAPMIKCDAERWLRAERTCGALKAGLSGTWFKNQHGGPAETQELAPVLPRA
jgi:hypothetical protein